MRSGQLIEKRPGHPAKSSRTESETDTYEGASMSHQTTSTSTLTTTAEDWHPTWCMRGEDCTTDRALADRHHQAIREEFPTTDGEDFAISTLWEVFGTPGDEYPMEVGVELQLTNTVCQGMHALASLSPNTMRDLADFLFTQADRLDAWHEQQRAQFGGDAA